METKDELRTSLLARRTTLGPERVAADAVGLAAGVRSVLAPTTRRVAAYLSSGSEPSTRPLVDTLCQDGIEVVVPRALAVRRTAWVPYRVGGELRRGRYGIDEPVGDPLADALERADAIILPAVAVDAAGRRLGRGGGYYDTTLAELDPAVLRIALVHDHELVERVPVDDHDQPVHVVVTPRRVLDLR
ncbi:5-formyltetrahydrofolate cyclo-ligase [Mumia flava]|uniref:5-formyltetrahydrofolate cyclo-ligase n=1 Tax=Mumia flava TaxID=1348852 RepID=A0A0B2BS30_9ACTN|nr:5-formyltetrahydrofolate cyclo-ligase [Mumia flava]PJJ56912.1 5-formyltetrahydrofolate cyclo-ligase [Mumia flava]